MAEETSEELETLDAPKEAGAPHSTLSPDAREEYKPIGAESGATERGRMGRVFIWLKLLAMLVLLAFVFILFLMIAYRSVNPPFSTLMLQQKLEGTSLHRQWVPLSRISPNLPIAVISAEDGQFCRHWGVDWGALRQVVEEVGQDGGASRGASTIPMQAVRNLFLWTSRSYVRKVPEIPLAMIASVLWPKRRMMEIYLNIVEWGPGTFGAEAASQLYFHKHAADLSAQEAALLAAALPNPRERDPAHPTLKLTRIAAAIERRMPILAPRSACVFAQR